jgi:predicted ATPase
MQDNALTSPQEVTEIIRESVAELEAKYRGKQLFDPRGTKRNYRKESLDRFADTETTPVFYKAEVQERPTITDETFLEKLRESFLLYKKMQNIPTLYFHPVNTEMVKEIAKWITGDLSGSLNPIKGLYIYGRHGSGKTDFSINLINTAKVLSQTYSNVPKFKPYSYNAIYEAIRSGSDIIDLVKDQSNLVIDDFLYQDRNEAKIFGNTDRVADIIVTKMYDLHKSGYLHIVTSNYPPDQIDMHPGSIDRMNEMFNYIFWEGESLRR